MGMFYTILNFTVSLKVCQNENSKEKKRTFPLTVMDLRAAVSVV